MDISEDGFNQLVAREALKTKAYWDKIGKIWTIGVGHTAMAGPPRVFRGMTVTKDEALQIFRRDLVAFEDTVDRTVKIKLKPNEFDALVSLAFNIGPDAFAKSSVVRYLNRGDKLRAADAFRLWNKGGKPRRVIKGLVKRREGERAQFLGE